MPGVYTPGRGVEMVAESSVCGGWVAVGWCWCECVGSVAWRVARGSYLWTCHRFRRVQQLNGRQLIICLPPCPLILHLAHRCHTNILSSVFPPVPPYHPGLLYAGPFPSRSLLSLCSHAYLCIPLSFHPPPHPCQWSRPMGTHTSASKLSAGFGARATAGRRSAAPRRTRCSPTPCWHPTTACVFSSPAPSRTRCAIAMPSCSALRHTKSPHAHARPFVMPKVRRPQQAPRITKPYVTKVQHQKRCGELKLAA